MDEVDEAAGAELKHPWGFEGLGVGGKGVRQEAVYLNFPYVNIHTNNYTI